MPTYWYSTASKFAYSKKQREKLEKRRQMKWERIKLDFARKRNRGRIGIDGGTDH